MIPLIQMAGYLRERWGEVRRETSSGTTAPRSSWQGEGISSCTVQDRGGSQGSRRQARPWIQKEISQGSRRRQAMDP